jgi:DNA helicase-2/ATP-dependent DNA helicase PcrA
LKLMKEGGVEAVKLPPADAVEIMTIHQAKGLEWPVVVVGAAMDGRLPAQHRRDRYEIPRRLCASGEPEVADPHLVDERKLFYVAVTRARDLLIVGTADVVNKRGGGPSPFVYELFGDDLRNAADLGRKRIEESETRRAIRTGPRPRHSFSELAYYLQCPLRYKFALVYGLQGIWVDPVDFGANVHRALEAIHRRALTGEPPEESELPALVNRTWVAGRHADPEAQAGAQRAAVNQLRRYLREHGKGLPRVRQAEASFSAAVGEHILLGKVDLLQLTDGENLEIVDFKTSAAVPVAAEGIDLQLDLYALGIENSQGHRVSRQSVHFLGDGRLESWLWTPERKIAAQQRLADILDRIGAGQFPPQQAYCDRCHEYRSICPYATTGSTDRSDSA